MLNTGNWSVGSHTPPPPSCTRSCFPTHRPRTTSLFSSMVTMYTSTPLTVDTQVTSSQYNETTEYVYIGHLGGVESVLMILISGVIIMVSRGRTGVLIRRVLFWRFYSLSVSSLLPLFPSLRLSLSSLPLLSPSSLPLSPSLHLSKENEGWFFGTSHNTGCSGLYPGNYVEKVKDSACWMLHR